jgi:serine protease Do
MLLHVRPLVRWPALAVILFLCAALEAADEPRPAIKPVPEALDDLRALEKRVQAVVAKVTPSVVGLSAGPGQGSGVIVRDGLVLTAGHVSGQPDRDILITLPDGKKLKGKALGRNQSADSGMVRIADKGDWPAAEVGKSSDLKKGQWVVAIAHPGGFRVNRTPVVRLGRVLSADAFVIQTDCPLVGGDSGGPLFDLDGKVVGINSRIGTAMNQNFHVPADSFLASWSRLARGESWGTAIGEPQPVTPTPGGRTVFSKTDRLVAGDPKDAKRTLSHYKVYELKMSPGFDYTIDMTGGDRKIPFDPYLRVEDSSGKDIAEDDDGAGEMNARLVFRPVQEDVYRITVTTCDPDQTGEFRLTVRQFDLKDWFYEGQVDVFAAFKMSGEVAASHVAKMSKARRALWLRATVFDAADRPAHGKEVAFLWKDGKSKATTNDKGVARLALTAANVKELALDLPADHRVLLELTDPEDRPLLFPYSDVAELSKEKKAGAGGPIVLEARSKLTDTDPEDKAKPRCRHQVHTLKLAAGETYTFDLESTRFDAYLRLEDSASKVLAQDDDSAGNLNARIVYRATKDDTVRIIVTSADPGRTGAYYLAVRHAEGKGKKP